MTKIDFNAVIGHTIRWQKQRREHVRGTFTFRMVDDGHHDYLVTGVEPFDEECHIFVCLEIIIDEDKDNPTSILLEPKELAGMLDGIPTQLSSGGYYMLLP